MFPKQQQQHWYHQQGKLSPTNHPQSFPHTDGVLCLAVALTVVAAGAQDQQKDLVKVNQEMKYITESLDDLIGQLSLIKQEATGRLSKYKGGLSSVSATDEHERIRQTKVSRFILKRVSELESESLKMRDDLAQLSKLQLKEAKQPTLVRDRRFVVPVETKQEDLDFDELTTTTQEPSSTTQQQQGMPAQPTTTTTTTTMKPEEEAAKIGFDIEALKKLGEEIGKRLDQFGKEAAKNLGDLIEGVKLVFREPASKNTTTASKNNSPGKKQPTPSRSGQSPVPLD